MIFTGDIALPFIDSITINKSVKFFSQNWFGNLEGGIIDNSNHKHQKDKGVFNDLNAINALNKNFNFIGFCIR